MRHAVGLVKNNDLVVWAQVFPKFISFLLVYVFANRVHRKLLDLLSHGLDTPVV